MKIEPLPHTAAPVASAHLVKSTMLEWGDRLPYGIFEGARILRDFAFHPPTMGTRKKLGALRTRKDLVNNPGKFVSYWLATALSSLGGEDLASMKLEAAALKVGQLTIGDCMYLILRWNMHARPEGLPLPGRSCAACGKVFDELLVDLSTVEMTVLADLDHGGDLANEGKAWGEGSIPPLVRVGLARGFPLGKEVARTVMLRAPSWMDSYWSVTRESWLNNDLKASLAIKGAICGTDVSAQGVVPMASIDELWPEDASRIDEALELVTATPDMHIEIPCPACKQVNADAIDWSDPGFFG